MQTVQERLPHTQSDPHPDLGLFHDIGQFLFPAANSFSACKIGMSSKKRRTRSTGRSMPTDPAAEMILPQFGSPPKKAVLTRFELAMA